MLASGLHVEGAAHDLVGLGAVGDRAAGGRGGDAGGLFALFFGVGAIVVAPLAALGVPEAVQWVAFTVFSVASLLGLRRRLTLALSKGPPAAAELVGEQAVVLVEVPVQRGGAGRAARRALVGADRRRGAAGGGPALPGGAGRGVDAVASRRVTART